MGHSELTEATDHDCASLFCSQCVNSMPDSNSFAGYFKVIAVVNTLAPNATWSKRKIEELVGMFYNYNDWLSR